MSLFTVILKMNLIASISAILMLAVRFLLQKIGCSRRITFLLWLIVAFRLVCPFSFGNGLSVFNLFNNRGAEYSKNFENAADDVRIIAVNTPTAKNTATAKNAAAAIWLFGTAVLLILGVAAYIRLDRRLRFATKYSDNIFVAENISSSFVFGIFRPKIYIPAHICSEQLPYIIAHEKMHIKKLDHIIKLFAYMLLAVHWFNPINVILFRIFEDDMELRCDECVINGRNAEYKNGYAKSLLQSAAAHSLIYFCTVGFSGNIAKKRIENVLNKRNSVSAALSIFISTLTAVSLCTNPVSGQQSPDMPVQAELPHPEIQTSEKNISAEITQSDMTPPKPAPPTDAAHAAETSQSAPTASKPFETPIASGQSLSPISSEKPLPTPIPQKALTSKRYLYSGGKSVQKGIVCTEDNKISLMLNMNTDCIMHVEISDSQTGEILENADIFADGKTQHDFIFDSDYEISNSGTAKNDPSRQNKYDISISSASDWTIEGEYTIYADFGNERND